jgi:hypothetical protein
MSRNDIVDQAFKDSRDALSTALRHLRTLQTDIEALSDNNSLEFQRIAAADPPEVWSPDSADPAFNSAMADLLTKHKRNIAVVSKRLLIVPNPTRADFSDNLDKVIKLCAQNLALAKSILAAGTTGLCDPSLPANHDSLTGDLSLPWAWTLASQPDPKTHLCEPFFDTTTSRELRRDIVTHEYFHRLPTMGADISVNNVDDALRNPNTIAQIVAFLTDRNRQVNSDGNERAVPPFPAP